MEKNTRNLDFFLKMLARFRILLYLCTRKREITQAQIEIEKQTLVR